MISFDDHSDFRRTVASYNEQLMQMYRRQAPDPPLPDEMPISEEFSPPEETPIALGFSVSEETLPIEQPPADDRILSTGYLQFFTTTARMAEPIPRAHVTVTRDGAAGEEIVAAVFTDISGMSPVLSLPAVDSRYSLTPEDAQPYTLYNATVTADGYYSQRLNALELYGGSTAFQTVALVPLPLGTASGITAVTDKAPKL